MIWVYGLVSVWIAWVWVDYFRLIDIYEKESLKYVLLIFVLGGLSVFVVFGLNDLLFSRLSFELNGQFLNDFLYYSLRVGAVEELAKLLPFVLFYFLFRAQLDEPIDYLFYGCASALGFAAVENTLYFSSYGAHIIHSRAILSTVGHMMWTGIICYGIVQYKFLHKKRDLLGLFGYFALAAFGHGFFNFWLAYAPFQGNGVWVTLAYFLLTISLFAGMLNNSINNSAFFTYHKVIHASRVSRRLFIHYGIILLAQFLILAYTSSIGHALVNLHLELWFPGIVVAITILRLSRFTLIKDSWDPLPLEFPFVYQMRSKAGHTMIGIRGNAFEDVLADGYFRQSFWLYSLSPRQPVFRTKRRVYTVSRHFLSEDEPAYRAKIYHAADPEQFTYYLLVAKSYGARYRGEYPIVGIYEILKPMDEVRQPDDHFKLLGWGYVVKEPVQG